MKKYIIIVLSFLVFSCGEHEDVIFDNHNSQTLAYFKSNNADLQIPIGDGNIENIDIVFGVSTLSSQDRTITFTIDEDNTNAPDSMYTIDSFSITIPANEYNGSTQMTGYYDSILDIEKKVVTLTIDGITGENGIIEQSKQMKITLSMYCPVPDSYATGMYLLEQTSAYVDGPTLDDGAIVEVISNGTTRSFSTSTYPDYCSNNPINFEFKLVCNEVVVDVQDTKCSCGDPEGWFGPAITNSTYDLSDDSVIFVTFTDDVKSNCGSTNQTTYKLTKQ